jgi:uncharacterized protein (DUF983 family)
MLPEYDSNDEYAELCCPECGEEEEWSWDISAEWVHCHSCGHDWDPRDEGDFVFYQD